MYQQSLHVHVISFACLLQPLPRAPTGTRASGARSWCSAVSSSSTGSTSRWSASRSPRSAPTWTSPPPPCSGSCPATCSATAACCCWAAASPTCSGAGACCSARWRSSRSPRSSAGWSATGPCSWRTRFLKGAAAAFTAPASLSIITTTFAEGPARNRALSIYTAVGASGFSLGLVFGGLMTELGWRWTFLLPVPVAVALLIAAPRVLPKDGPIAPGHPAQLRLRRRRDAHGGHAAARAHDRRGARQRLGLGRHDRRAGRRRRPADDVRRHRAPQRQPAGAARASCAPRRCCGRTSG